MTSLAGSASVSGSTASVKGRPGEVVGFFWDIENQGAMLNQAAAGYDVVMVVAKWLWGRTPVAEPNSAFYGTVTVTAGHDTLCLRLCVPLSCAGVPRGVDAFDVVSRIKGLVTAPARCTEFRVRRGPTGGPVL